MICNVSDAKDAGLKTTSREQYGYPEEESISRCTAKDNEDNQDLRNKLRLN